jgi:hypothetical protein
MGKIRVASAMTNSMEDNVSHGLHRDPGLDGGRPLPATGDECRDPEIDVGVQSGQAPDFSRSRGYGRYEI